MPIDTDTTAREIIERRKQVMTVLDVLYAEERAIADVCSKLAETRRTLQARIRVFEETIRELQQPVITGYSIVCGRNSYDSAEDKESAFGMVRDLIGRGSDVDGIGVYEEGYFVSADGKEEPCIISVYSPIVDKGEVLFTRL